ncbi:MAG: NAD-dependent DNA ligase LigA, partial [Christensenellales bacterium]
MSEETMRPLVDELNRYSYHYYVLSESLVSDKEFDELFDRLLEMERETGVVLADSPTRRVGSVISGQFAPHDHVAPLWSLDKAQSFEALEAWDARIRRLMEASGEELAPLRYAVEYKFDGLTINLTYDGGFLVQAATRGTGTRGEIILDQVRTMRDVPLSIPYKGFMEVQGEGMMRLSVLREYNETAREPLKNARNAAAGALRNLDVSETAKRRLNGYFYQVGAMRPEFLFDNHADMIRFLKDNRFPISPYFEICGDIEEVKRCIEAIQRHKSELDFLIDGAVVKVADFKTRRVLGGTDRFPRWAMAYKFSAQEAAVLLHAVTWDVGRTGKLTPLAHIEPVELAGATIRRATLNNIGDIARKGVKVGARVWVRRANDVIPEITGSAEEDPCVGEEIIAPEHCPACGAAVEEVGANLFCPNSLSCKPQLVKHLVHYASRQAMDIATFSEKTAQLLMEKLGVTQVADLYTLTFDQLIELEGFQEKRVNNLLREIHQSRQRPLDAFLYALGIPGVGRKTARDISAHFGDFESVRAADLEELLKIDEVGPVIAENIRHFFGDGHIAAGIDRLLSLGVSPKSMKSAKAAESLPLAGKTFVLTGALSLMTRNEAGDRLMALG